MSAERPAFLNKSSSNVSLIDIRFPQLSDPSSSGISVFRRQLCFVRYEAPERELAQETPPAAWQKLVQAYHLLTIYTPRAERAERNKTASTHQGRSSGATLRRSAKY